MRHIFLTLGLLIPLLSFAQETSDLKEYSYTELVDMIQAEEDTIFRLSDAKIYFEPKTDSSFLINQGETRYITVDRGLRKDTLHIQKRIDLRNVEFEVSVGGRSTRMWVGFSKVKFHKPVLILNPHGLVVSECKFEDLFLFGQEPATYEPPKRGFNDFIFLNESHFLGNTNVYIGENNISGLSITGNLVKADNFGIFNRGRRYLDFNSNHITAEDLSFLIDISSNEESPSLEMLNNTFMVSHPGFSIKTSNLNSVQIAKNKWEATYISIDIDDFSAQSIWLDWNQFQGEFIEVRMFRSWMKPEGLSPFERNGYVPDEKIINSSIGSIFTDRNVNYYLDTIRIQDIDVYNAEQALKGKFYDFYKGRHENSAANAIYLEIKDLETERLAYLHNINPTFKTFFKWRINQFLKVFSAYGTEPERAIIFSMYVILAFALVYLFFPNHWDSHGKNRIVDRFSFFLKYMKRDAGMQDVYLEEKQGDILAYDEYKQLLESSGKDVPKFFQATGLPLYKWAISGTKLTAGFLSRVDVMKGTWSELPQSKRVWKSVLLITAFLIALTYDILIKMLNALMLSINTFTTLGFGEIPIKGLPRYLAIIQGFIGWFMLTIFSVSLISQLLN